MSHWRYLCIFLFLSQIAVAEEKWTANQVIQHWIATQQELPVEKVSFSRLEFDRIFLRQTNRLCEVVYVGATSGQMTSKPWPSDIKPVRLREEYKLNPDDPEWNVSWDDDKITFHEFDGTLKSVLKRPFKISWFQAPNFLENQIPPIFPGRVNRDRIARFDWNVTARKPDTIWLKGVPKLALKQDTDIPTWEVIIEIASWKTRAIRQLDSAGNREVVMLIR